MIEIDKGGRITRAGCTPNRECLVMNYEKPARMFGVSTAAETTGEF